MPKHVDSMLGHEDCLVANSRLTDPQQQNSDDRNCSDDNVERSTSADWQTADADDQQSRRLMCSCSPGTAEPFLKETDTSASVYHRLLQLQRGTSVQVHTCYLPYFPSYLASKMHKHMHTHIHIYTAIHVD